MIQTKAAQMVAENPFYGMKQTLDLGQQLTKLGDGATPSYVDAYLNAAWQEAKSTKEKRELFFTIIFTLGDISNREHNIFRKKGIKNVDGGGTSARKIFLLCLSWIIRVVPNQFYEFLPIIGEYYNLDGMMFYEIKTDRFRGTIEEILKLEVDMNVVTTYIASVLKNPKTSDNEKKLWAKWLWHIPTKKRQKKFVVTEIGLKSVKKKYGNDYKVGDTVKGSREKQNQTKAKDTWTLNNIHMLSEKMGWEVVKHPNNVNYVGYRVFKKQFLADSEATMFSSQRIKELDKTELLNWFDQLPSGARFRTQTRLLDKDKSGKLTSKSKWITNKGLNIGDVYQEWLKMKDVAQQELRNLSKEDKEKLAKEDPKALKLIEKAAKVNTGANTLLDVVADFFKAVNSKGDVDLMADSILNKMKAEVPVLVIADVSGSMASAAVTHKNVTFSAKSMAQLLTTMFLLKNPDETGGQMFLRFDNTAEVITTGQLAATQGANRFMATSSTVVKELVDPKKKFSENYNNIGQYVIARGGTNFESVTQGFKSWVDSDSNMKSIRIEQINKYPVMLVVSDGDMNSHSNAAQSMAAFQQSMKQWFGWTGVVVVWDCHMAERSGSSKFDGLENVIYYSGVNTSIVNSIFTNIHDLDVIDIYTVLKSLHQSNRYSPVRELVK